MSTAVLEVPGIPAEPADLRARQHRMLADFDLLDVPHDAELDAATRLAATVTGFPICMINLLDTERTCQLTVTGIPAMDVGRDTSLCNRASLVGGLVTSEDATVDPRFADLPWVDGRWAAVRRYASAPLVVDGLTMGTLCVFDLETGPPLSQEQRDRLLDLAAIIVALLERRRDVRRTEQARADLAVAHGVARVAALHDGLTGLPNRLLLTDRLQEALSVRGVPVAVLFCDLDGFKAVNDQHGHAAGDAVLVETAHRLVGAVRPGDTVARIGGDEFVVLCPGARTAAQAAAIAARIRAAMAAGIEHDGLVHHVGVSVGVTTSQVSSTPDSLLSDADHAMYAVKKERRAAVR